MLGISRMGIDTVGGGLIIEGATNVYANQAPVVRVGDRVAPHPSHSNVVMVGHSSTVYANGKQVCRQNDVASCLHLATGSSNVFAG